jgi:putative transposase
MPRQARVTSSTGVYHIMMRGNEKKNIFLCAKDKNKFLEILKEKKQEHNFILYAYCIMDNHFHLLIKELVEDISTIMKRVNTAYAYYFNHKYERVGHVFQDRFRSEAIENDAYLIQVVRYIHNNPVKASLCNSHIQYPWSSYHQYINQKPGLVDFNEILNLFSSNKKKSIEAFIDFSNLDAKYPIMDIDYKQEIEDHLKGVMMDFLSCQNRTNIDVEINTVFRDQLIQHLKKESNASIRQIAAFLGVNKNIVHKA